MGTTGSFETDQGVEMAGKEEVAAEVFPGASVVVDGPGFLSPLNCKDVTSPFSISVFASIERTLGVRTCDISMDRKGAVVQEFIARNCLGELYGVSKEEFDTPMRSLN